MSVFEEINKNIITRAGQITGKIKAQYEKHKDDNKNREEYIQNLELSAKEAGIQINSTNFPKTQKFYADLIQRLYKDLKNIWLTSDLDDHEAAKRSVIIAARIEQIEIIRMRPQKLIDELTEATK